MVIMLMIPLGFAAIGAIISYSMLKAIRLGFESRSWPSTFGKIIKSEAKKIQETTSNGKGVSTRYEPLIQYSFTVGGNAFNSNRLSAVGRFYATAQSAQKIVEAYTSGSAVQVYYQPDDPKKSVLIPGNGGGNFAALAMSLLFVVGGLAGAVFGFLHYRR